MIGWKKLALVSLFSGAGMAAALALIGLAVYRYKNRSEPPKAWPTIDFPDVGLRLSLETELRSGKVRYQFWARPLSDDLAKDFERVADSGAEKIHFGIILADAGGFHLCKCDVEVIPGTDDKSVIAALHGNGELTSCSVDDYRDARQWHATHIFPKLFRAQNIRELVNDTEFLALAPARQKEALRRVTGDQDFSKLSDPEVSQFVAKWTAAQTKKKHAGLEPLSDSDELSSFETSSGTLVTNSGMTFSIPRGYSRLTITEWARSGTSENRAPLHYSCDATGHCTIENRWNGQTVEANLLMRTP